MKIRDLVNVVGKTISLCFIFFAIMVLNTNFSYCGEYGFCGLPYSIIFNYMIYFVFMCFLFVLAEYGNLHGGGSYEYDGFSFSRTDHVIDWFSYISALMSFYVSAFFVFMYIVF